MLQPAACRPAITKQYIAYTSTQQAKWSAIHPSSTGATRNALYTHVSRRWRELPNINAQVSNLSCSAEQFRGVIAASQSATPIQVRTPGSRLTFLCCRIPFIRHRQAIFLRNDFFTWASPGPFFFIFVFPIQLTDIVQYNFLPMTGFEPRASGVGSDHSTN